MKQIAALERKCEEIVYSDVTQASSTCGAIIEYIEEVSGGVFDYDARIFDYDFTPLEDVVNNFLNKATKSDDIYKAIHI